LLSPEITFCSVAKLFGHPGWRYIPAGSAVRGMCGGREETQVLCTLKQRERGMW
jgi:hypothetical protein